MDYSTKCSNCNSEISNSDVFCSNCGYPENGSDQEKNKFNYRIKLRQDVVKDAKQKLVQIQFFLAFLGVLYTALGMYFLYSGFNLVDYLANFIVAAIFFACIYWVKKQPLTGVISAFIFWIILQLSVVFEDPSLLIRGIVLKIIIIGVFIKGITNARDYKEFSSKLENLHE